MNDSGFGFGGFEDPSPSKPMQRRSSARQNIYAKSREQKMLEQQEDLEYQELLAKEKERQDNILSGFGGDFGGDADERDNQSPEDAQFGFKLWGSAVSANVVIPPFVPRDQRNKRKWDVGKMKKSECDKHILAANHGEFLIRETQKGDRHVVSVNDQGNLYEAYIRHVNGNFLFMSREFTDLGDIVNHLQRNPLYNKQGLPLYIDKPARV